uniref:Uncharacterized protein n=1 Tax=Haptolina brevifila TaxID=156173 RepID=A0A7S2JAB3_9EUKA|mmetsp:Transcript_79257/g.157595  ORF Transcript_79257/g.157595 Transcript_79257/m.157595 type:complete len:133 (+) Transcript_79257:228-626(+)
MGSGMGAKHAEFGALMHNIASCLHCLGDLPRAKQYYERALVAFDTPPPSRMSYLLFGDVDRKRCEFVRERLVDIEFGRLPDLTKFLDGYGKRREVTDDLKEEKRTPSSYGIAGAYPDPFLGQINALAFTART